MTKRYSKYYILVLLIVLFIAPGVAAYIFYQHPSWLGSTRINKGTLLNPPILLNALEGKSKWRIIFWSPNDCGQTCMHQLDVLARIRLALGRKLYQVDQWLVLGDKASSLSEEQQVILKNIDFKVMKLSKMEEVSQNPLFKRSKVYVADPENYLILKYAAEVNPEDVYKDLKLLLSITENKSG
jgi:hypothetical protein